MILQTAAQATYQHRIREDAYRAGQASVANEILKKIDGLAAVNGKDYSDIKSMIRYWLRAERFEKGFDDGA